MPPRRTRKSTTRRIRPANGASVAGDRRFALLREENRRHAEQWLDATARYDEELAQYARMFDEAPVPYLILDEKGGVHQLNAAAAALLGKPVERIVGKPFVTFVERASARTFMLHLTRCSHGQTATEVSLRSDPPRAVRLISRPSVAREHRLYFTVATDISDQRRSETALRVSERRHREIVEAANEGICIVNDRNEIIFANHRMATMVGTTLDDLNGRSAFDFVPPEDIEEARVAFERREMGRFNQSEQRLRRLDGSAFMTNISTTLLRDDHGRFIGMLRMFTDATARHELIAARRALMRQILEAQENERQRIARELHDQMGQHIVAFSLGLARLESVTQGNDDAAATVAQLRRLADLLGRDVHNLALELRPAALDHLGLAVALTSYVESIAQRSNLEIDLHCDGLDTQTLEPSVQTALYRIAQEALTNIVKHAGASRVSVILEARPDAVQLIVEDDGVGFNPSLTRRSTLGLQGMKERAELVSGTVALESAPEKGTTLFVRIPLTTQGHEHDQETSVTSS